MSKSNAARHGLKVGDMVGILGPTSPLFPDGKGNSGYIGKIGRVKIIKRDGKCLVRVNGRHNWFAEGFLSIFRRKKPRRKTAHVLGCKEYTSGALASVPESPWQAKAENWRVMFPDWQNVKIEDVCAGTSFSAPPFGEYEVTVGAGAGSEPQPEAPKAEPKFKIGDRVEIYRCTYLWNILCDKVGAVGTVVRVNVNENTYMVDFRDGREYWWVPGRVLRHAPAEPSPTTESAPEPEKPQFKPFDRVLVKIADKWQPNIFLYKRESGLYQCAYGDWENMIPYEGNEALLGTTNDPEKG